MSQINDNESKNNSNITGFVGRTRLILDLDSLAWNMRLIRKAAGAGASVCAAVKANAYGHGAAQAAKVFLTNGADSLCVATLGEAVELREANIEAPVLILGSLEPGCEREVVKRGFFQTVSTYDEMKALSDAAKLSGETALVHIKVDTGMNRLGFIYSDADAADRILAASALPNLQIAGIFTHFASSDESDPAFTYLQLERFNGFYNALARRGLAIPVRHCSNSAAIFGFPGAHMNMVRPGIALYGGGCDPGGAHHINPPLRRAMTLRTRLSLVKNVAIGESVSYNRRFTARRPSKIAVMPIGYADGYDRALSYGRGQVLIRGKRAPIAGTICMDQCMADVTDIDGAAIGDEAVLIGKQGPDEITFEELTKTLNTSPHEIMCSIGRRVPRVYMQNGATVGVVNYM